MTGRQLLLDLPSGPGLGRDDFLPGPSSAGALAAVEAWQNWPGGRLLLVGQPGSGRTHLAHIWAEASGAPVITGRDLRPDLLDAAPGPLAIDDAHCAAGHREAEETLFHLWTRGSSEAPLLLTAPLGPAAWGLDLPDLESRLLATHRADLAAPEPEQMEMVLVKLCHDRQLALSDPALRYLATRLDRSFALAARVVAALDEAALRERRPVTRATAITVLRELGLGGDDWTGAGPAVD